ncbi:MAG TPA: hypothetical protein VG388_04370 [Solirubrobacteraceae bacterium]|nr:hypothetical protein [Solirubrobacteraceae bacterium]
MATVTGSQPEQVPHTLPLEEQLAAQAPDQALVELIELGCAQLLRRPG